MAMMNIRKKVQNLAVNKMQERMDRAAEKTVLRADKERGFDDVTGNLYKSIAVGTFYNGELQSVHHTPGPAPTRPTLAKGERYNLTHYYRNPVPLELTKRRPFRGRFGEGGQDGEEASEDMLGYLELVGIGPGDTWRMVLLSGVSYASYVEQVFKHDVISSLGEYMIRHFKRM